MLNYILGVIVGIISTFVFIILTNDVVKEDNYRRYKEGRVLVSAVSAGIVPEYSVVCYYVKGKSPYTGYLLRDNEHMTLINPISATGVALSAEDLVELLATPAATACFYIGHSQEAQ